MRIKAFLFLFITISIPEIVSAQTWVLDVEATIVENNWGCSDLWLPYATAQFGIYPIQTYTNNDQSINLAKFQFTGTGTPVNGSLTLFLNGACGSNYDGPPATSTQSFAFNGCANGVGNITNQPGLPYIIFNYYFHYILPDPGPITPSNGSLCPLTPLNGSPPQSTPLEINTPTIISGTELVWEYKLNGGSSQSMAITTPTSPKSSAIFTLPNTAQPNDSYVFSVYPRYIACPNIRSLNNGFSVPVSVFPAAPTFNIPSASILGQICNADGSFQITGISTSSSQVYIRLRNTDTNLGVDSFTEGVYSKSDKTINVPAGNYQIQMENYPGGCFINGVPFNIGIQQAVNSLTVTPIPTDPLCNNGLGSISASATGTTGAVSFSLNNSAYNATNPNPITGLLPDSYTVYAIDVNGCRGNANTTLNNPLPLTVPVATVTSGALSNHNGRDISCVGANDGQVTVSSSDGTGTLFYSLDNGLTYPTSTGVFSSLSPGSYAYKVKDSNDCIKDGLATILVTNPPALLPGTTSVTNPLCNVSTGAISVNGTSGGTGSYQYSLNGTTFQTGNVLTNVPAGTYSITIKDANSCTVVIPTSVTLTAPQAISVTNAIVNPSCFGANNGSITVTATNGVGALQYSRNGGSTFQTSNIFNTGITSGAYSIVVKDANGCLSSVSTAVVSQPSAVSGAIATPPPFTCFSTSNSTNLNLTPTGGTAGYTFLWSTGSTTEDINITLGASLSSNYSVTITDNKGCTANRSITITQPAQLSSSAVSSNITCFGTNNGSVNLTQSGGTAPYTFLWNTGATTEDLSARPTGTYSVTVTDFNGCTSTASAIVTQPTALNLTQGFTTNVSCNGLSNGSVNLIASGGTGAFEYSKDGVIWQSSSLITGLAASAHALRLRDQNNCTTQLNVAITQPSVLSISVSNIINAACGQANGSAQSAGTGGTGSYTFAWRNSLNQIVSTNALLTNVVGGIYGVTITDQNGCTDFKNVAISSPNGPVATINSVMGTSCASTNDGRASISVSSGQAPYTIAWNNGETGLNPVGLKPGAGINIVTITDAANCSTAQVVDVPSPPALEVIIQNTIPPACPGGMNASALVLAQGGTSPYSYSWNTGALGATLSNVSAGTYQVTANDGKNCTTVFSVNIADKPPILIATTSQTPPSCVGKTDGSISVTATGGTGAFLYSWNTGATTPGISNIGAGTYTVTATDALSCSAQTQIIFANPAPLALDLGPNRKICVGGSITLLSPVDAASYLWTSSNGFTSSAKQVILTQAGDYNLKVINANGCIAEDNFTLNTATDLLSADFLMAPLAHVGDTVVAIDISWPVPDGINWSLPSAATILEQTADYLILVFKEEGKFPIRLTASLAQCQDEYSASIEILKRDDKTGGENPTSGLIKSLTAFPNPTSENRINLKIELNEVAPVRVRLVSLERNSIITDINDQGNDVYEYEIRLEGVAKGVYFLVVDVLSEKRVIRILVI
jgi:hypothetical protein